MVVGVLHPSQTRESQENCPKSLSFSVIPGLSISNYLNFYIRSPNNASKQNFVTYMGYFEAI